MRRAALRFLSLVLCGSGVLLTVSASLEAQTTKPSQEIGDVEFRTLNVGIPGLSIDYHNGIFQNFAGVDPADLNNYNIIEMLGETTSPCGTGPGAVTDSLYCFSNVPNTSYKGAYTIPYIKLTRAQRVSIIATAVQEEALSQTGAIGYIDDPVTSYVSFDPTREQVSGFLDLGAVRQMRSDAFTEFAYASNGFPIVCAGGCAAGGVNLTIQNDTSFFIQGAILYRSLPRPSCRRCGRR